MDDTCVAVNLGINGVSEEDEEDPGGYVGVNNDDDNNNDTADKDESGTVSGEDDLVSISLSISPSADTGEATLSATAGGSKIKVWENSTKGTEVSLPKSWYLSSESVPGTLYVEGIIASSDDRDIELKLSLNGSGSCDDKIKFTCIEARKIPLGYSANLSKFIIGKVYERKVPAKYTPVKK